MKKTAKPIQIPFFSEYSLVILVSIVTLLLQLISFATTWEGSKVYLEGIFPFASLLFALAIQATAYFLSNSLRTKVSILKLAALLAAMCCSTYYSYIGIYNSVNSPANYLQQNYMQISDELTRIFDTELENGISEARTAVGEAALSITSRVTSLFRERENMEACRKALESVSESYSSGMRAPKQSAYENYEDYVAAYNAYIAGISQGIGTENSAARERVLSSYGFASMDALIEAESRNSAELSALSAALRIPSSGTEDEFTSAVSALQNALSVSIGEASVGAFSIDTALLNNLFQAAGMCGYGKTDSAHILNTLQQCAGVTAAPFIADYETLVSALPDGRVTSADIMELKLSMDSEILSAFIKINTLLPSGKQLSVTDSRFQLTDLYLLPVKALSDSSTRLTALFCLFVAALIDGLSLLFAISLRKRKPLWARRVLTGSGFEDFAPQIYALLPGDRDTARALSEFLFCFMPSPDTESDGYMLYADMESLTGYYTLTAFLCQVNLAKIVPAGFLGNEKEALLLKSRFVFWANEIIFGSQQKEQEVLA